MYIIKNALRCIGRAKGRNLLIGVIVFILAASACIGLSIRQAAENAKESTLDGLSVTATISYDRRSMMSSMKPPEGGTKGERPSFDKEQFSQTMSKAQSLTLEEYQKYAAASTVQDFYYTQTVYCNGNESFVPVENTTTTEDTSSTTQTPEENKGDFNPFGGGGPMGNMNPFMQGINTDSDFVLAGYSSDVALKTLGLKMESGSVFDEQTTQYQCIISSELAATNGIAKGDTIPLVNPNAEGEVYTFTVCGIYTTEDTNDFAGAAFGTNQDPANKILTSAAAVEKLMAASASVSTIVTGENGRETNTAITGQLEGTYQFANVEDYHTFEEEVRTLGLSESYTVSSKDITEYENSLTPLNTLSDMAGWFLLVIVLLGGIILMVLNIFSIRERKYEIGVLTAMGMKKSKVALQFLCEIFVVTMLAVSLGAGVGAVSSVPVTNALLENQVASQEQQETKMEEDFGRPANMPNMPNMPNMGDMGNMPDMKELPQGGDNNPIDKVMNSATNYVTQIESAVNTTVLLQMMGIGILLTLFAGGVGILFVMRYDPLKILANRD